MAVTWPNNSQPGTCSCKVVGSSVLPPRLWTPAQRRGYSWAAPQTWAGRWLQHPGQREAGGGLSAPGSHGQGAGVQGGEREARRAEGHRKSVRNVRNPTVLGIQAGKVFLSSEKKNGESVLFETKPSPHPHFHNQRCPGGPSPTGWVGPGRADPVPNCR